MELKRKAYQKLLEWKARPNHKPLIVEGLRQVGKSYLVSAFAKENYENVVVFDFRYDPKTRKFFQGDLSVDAILRNAYPYFPSSMFVSNKTAIVFEEIGDCAQARTALKSFALDGRFDVLATGSLLGVAGYRKGKKQPLPTGYEEFLELTSLDFEEFLWAIGATADFIQEIKNSLQTFKPLPEAYVEYGKQAIKAYMLVGGLPDAVVAFIESNGDFFAARRVVEGLLKDYEEDFGRYIDDNGEEKVDLVLKGRLSMVWKSIPIQLARENGNSKFRYASVGGRGRKEDFGLCIDWLEEAGLIVKSRNTVAPEPPLKSNAIDNEFKVFVADPGLLSACYEASLVALTLEELLGARKGALVENLIATMFHKAGLGCYYYANSLEHKEIDFLLEHMGGIVLVEAKSTKGGMGASKALVADESNKVYHNYSSMKVNESNFGEGSFYKTVPHYALPFYLSSVVEELHIQSFLPKCPS